MNTKAPTGSDAKGCLVLVVEDHPIFRDGLRLMLEAQPWVREVAEAGDAQEAINLARSRAVDVVVMDLRLPGLDGVSAIREVLAVRATARVLVLTDEHGREAAAAAVEAGAHGYLVKETAPEDVAEALHSVYRGMSIFGPSLESWRIALPSEYLKADTKLDRLTPREYDVLRLLASGSSTIDIGRKLDIAEKTVRNQLSVIFAKLEVPDRVAAVVLAHKLGMKTD